MLPSLHRLGLAPAASVGALGADLTDRASWTAPRMLQTRPSKYANDVARRLWGAAWHDSDKVERLEFAQSAVAELYRLRRLPPGTPLELTAGDMASFAEHVARLLPRARGASEAGLASRGRRRPFVPREESSDDDDDAGEPYSDAQFDEDLAELDVWVEERAGVEEEEEARRRAEGEEARRRAAEEEARRRAAEEEARRRAAEEEEARRRAAEEEAAPLHWHELVSDEESGGGVEQGTVGYDEALGVFGRHLRAQRGAVYALSEGSLPSSTFPLFEGAPTFPEGPVRVAVYRAAMRDKFKPSTSHCAGTLKAEHFYIHGEDGLLAGGGFRELFYQTKPVQRAVNPQSSSGYKDTPHKAMFVHNRGYLMNCTFLVGTRNGKPIAPCELTRVEPNWRIAYCWLEATRLANAELLARTPPATRLTKDAGPRDAREGVIGWDTPLDVPVWLRELFPKQQWSSPNFPKLQGGRLLFHRSGQSCATADAVVGFLKRTQPEQWRALYCCQVTSTAAMQRFVADEGRIGLAAWAHHARLLVKDQAAREIRIYDPWKQSVVPPAWAREAVEGSGYTLRFVARAADQAFNEGSCQLQAITRMLMAALYGEVGVSSLFSVDRPEELAVPVAVQLLVSRLRRR
jgi:hypothetical protein